MTLQLSTVAPLEAIARACNSVAGQAQTAEGRDLQMLLVCIDQISARERSHR